VATYIRKATARNPGNPKPRRRRNHESFQTPCSRAASARDKTCGGRGKSRVSVRAHNVLALGLSLGCSHLARPRRKSNLPPARAIPDRPEKLAFPPLTYEPPPPANSGCHSRLARSRMSCLTGSCRW